MPSTTIKIYSDYKSPYAYLAKDIAYQLAADTGAVLQWLPYTLDIPAYLGSAKVDAHGKVLEQNRNQHQWRRVKYSYMDCRRDASRLGLTVLGPKKIFNSTLANIGMLYAQEHQVFRPYHDLTFERFWKRELDIEDIDVIQALLIECGAPATGFGEFATGLGRERLALIQDQAHCAGVFGVPSFVLDDGELFWGREHIALIRERILSQR